VSRAQVQFRGRGLLGFGLGEDPNRMPTGYDLIAQGYAPTLVDCYAGQTCYATTLQTVAGPATRTYSFTSPDPAARATGTSASAPIGQAAPGPAAAGVVPVVTVTPPQVSVTPATPASPAAPSKTTKRGASVGTKVALSVAGAAIVGGAFLALRKAS
jgi:hypothetical protein